MKQTNFCILNVGLYRTGSATLAKAAEIVGFKVHQADLDALDASALRMLLLDPQKAIWKWWTDGRGKDALVQLIMSFDFVCGGYIPWLPLLPIGAFDSFCNEMKDNGITIFLVDTKREPSSRLKSELHQWVVNDLEAKANLNDRERGDLKDLLRARARLHAMALDPHVVRTLALEEMDKWPRRLEKHLKPVGEEHKQHHHHHHHELTHVTWEDALHRAGHRNPGPRLPLEGVLLSLRIGSAFHFLVERVDLLMKDLMRDRLCNMMFILAFDQDEAGTPMAEQLMELVRKHCPVHQITSPERDPYSPFPLCHVWDEMATEAFEKGCDWVMLLDDETKIDCAYHYRAFYRSFIDISNRLNCPFGFGCPSWNGGSYKGSMMFPVIGRVHLDIYGSLIPSNRKDAFVNKDLGAYLQGIYSKFGASPVVRDARVQTQTVNSDIYHTPYVLVDADGWRDWVHEDMHLAKEYLAQYSDYNCLLIDVVVPTYRLEMEFLEGICRLKVPDRVRTTFIFVVDNPTKLMAMYEAKTCDAAAKMMEHHLAELSGNNVCVRCNPVNLGASAARNQGLDESAAEYVLFLDDDILPDGHLLFEYEKVLRKVDPTTVGLLGMVFFPRRHNLSILHAAVLMSYLVYTFEIASFPDCHVPDWGVTANLFVKRTSTRFDVSYNAGGGEDVEFCLRLAKEAGGRFLPAPNARVTHDYWPGGLSVLLPHFFRFGVGDGALFTRYREYCYRSFPNAVEFFCFFLTIWFPLWFGGLVSLAPLVLQLLGLFLVDFGVEICNVKEFEHRRKLLEYTFPTWYNVMAHCIANAYVLVFDCGRMYGSLLRGELLENICKRFKWHCERKKPDPRSNFTIGEGLKFVGFVLVSSFNMYLWTK
jgi:glycosyltransferase involved in cell wall biosynthesis